MSFIDHSAIKRVTADDGLESITLRSDLAARYLFLNETLLEAYNLVSKDERYTSGLGLKETLLDDKIVDETKYLEDWLTKLQKEVDDETEGNIGIDNTAESTEINRKLQFLGELLDKLKDDKSSFNDNFNKIKTCNDEVLKAYEKEFGRTVVELKDQVIDMDMDEEEEEEEENENIDLSGAYRVLKGVKVKGVSYEERPNRLVASATSSTV